MVPVIANRGASFAGAFAYYFHDKNAWTTKRVAWTETLNLLTDCVDRAWKRMVYTAKHQQHLKRASGQCATGAKLSKPVFCYSLSWHPEQTPSQDVMMDAVLETLERLGLSEHQVIIAAHNDVPHPHVHVIVNAVHPLTGLVAKLKYTKRKLSEFALNYERKEGKMYCPKREENYAKREAGEKTKFCDPVIAEAWSRSTNGSEFMSLLKEYGYRLAKGRRIVVCSSHGKIINPARELGVKTKAFLNQLAGLDVSLLPAVEEVIKKLKNAQSETLPLFEQAELEAQQLNELAGKHWDERRGLSSLYQLRIDRKHKRLSVFYRIDELSDKVVTLRRKQEESGLLQKWFGLYRYRQQRLNLLELKLEKVSSCFNQAIDLLKKERDNALLNLKHMQAEEWIRLKNELPHWKGNSLKSKNYDELGSFLKKSSRGLNTEKLEPSP